MKALPYAVAWANLFFSTTRTATGSSLTSPRNERQRPIFLFHSSSGEVGQFGQHERDPLSLIEFDRNGGDENWPDFGRGQGGLMGWHIGLMSASWFFFLPCFLFLRTAKHPLALLPRVGFLVTLLLGTISMYKKLTPDLYEGETHSTLAWPILFFVVLLNIKDVLAKVGWSWGMIGLKTFWKSNQNGKGGLYSSLSHSEDETLLDEEEHPRRNSRMSISTSIDSVRGDSAFFDPDPKKFHLSRSSASSKLSTILKYTLIALERSLLFLGFAELCSGIVVYTGSCRQNYINGCLAHIIKGSIFFFYGLLTFARYLGAWSELGWAWNKRPQTHSWRDNAVSAEWVESFVIFLYGATQQFYERKGAHDGDPFTVKDVQHISIAVMLCWVGLLGLLIESRRLKKWITFSTLDRLNHRSPSEVEQPPTYNYSFNPLPAIGIMIVGLAMGSHHQTYRFQMTIHSLWGNLLTGFGISRLLTYFFLFVRPVRLSMPSPRPTEFIAAFCLTAGGVVFVESTEQVVFAAMRYEVDHVMGILNITGGRCLFLFGLKGWAQMRMSEGRMKRIQNA
ncbi:hypothetical protein BT69DRAFT_1280598 [Atractiella rhizophila]|nr:hypothetical protein BT69DRAFT_1280598 [Atractiella rhizophila]